MKFDWVSFLGVVLAIIGLVLLTAGLVLTLESGDGTWLLLWIPAAGVSAILSCRD